MINIIPVQSLPIFPEPTRLSHFLMGYVAREADGPNGFRWERGQLLYTIDGNIEKAIIPPLNLWNGVWKVCEEIDIWSWPQDRGFDDVCDGPGFWYTELELGSRRFSTKGCLVENLMIEGLVDLPADFKPKLLRFHRALQALTGWHEHNKEA